VQDRLTNNALFGGADPITSAVGGGDLAALRARRQAMDAQMSPSAKATADIASQFMPQNILLNRFGGPIVQGAVQRGLESYNRGNDWNTIGVDTRTGAETGVAAKILSGVKPSNLGPVAQKAVEAIPAYLGLKLGGDWATGWAADRFSQNFVKPIAEGVNKVVSAIPDPPPWLIQNAVIGGQPAAADTEAGKNAGRLASNFNWDDARTALQNLRGMLPF
jgi:hypothetical protein